MYIPWNKEPTGILICTSGECKMAQLIWKAAWQFLKNLNSHDPVIPLLGITQK
jgi:hypothetical protein